MGKGIRITAARRQKFRDLAARRNAGVKGGIVIDWATAKSARPGEERGVIAIIKPGGGRVMKPTTKAAAKGDRRHVTVKDLPARRSAGVKGGFVVNWAASN